MTGYLAYEPPLLVEIHSLEIGFVVCEDLVGLWDNPDLIIVSGYPDGTNFDRHASELSSSMTGRGRYCTGFRLNNTCRACKFGASNKYSPDDLMTRGSGLYFVP